VNSNLFRRVSTVWRMLPVTQAHSLPPDCPASQQLQQDRQI